MSDLWLEEPDLEPAARALAEAFAGAIARRDDEPIDVCRFHREMVDTVLGNVDVVPRVVAERLADALEALCGAWRSGDEENGAETMREALVLHDRFREEYPRDETKP
jgi:hypothetical protein